VSPELDAADFGNEVSRNLVRGRQQLSLRKYILGSMEKCNNINIDRMFDKHQMRCPAVVEIFFQPQAVSGIFHQFRASSETMISPEATGYFIERSLYILKAICRGMCQSTFLCQSTCLFYCLISGCAYST